MSEAISSLFKRQSNGPIEKPLRMEDFAENATGRVRLKLDEQIHADYNSIQSIKTKTPDTWSAYLVLVSEKNRALQELDQDYTESNRLAYQQAVQALEKHPIYHLTRRLESNFSHLREAVSMAKKLGKPYQAIPDDISQSVQKLIVEAENTGKLSTTDLSKHRTTA